MSEHFGDENFWFEQTPCTFFAAGEGTVPGAERAHTEAAEPGEACLRGGVGEHGDIHGGSDPPRFFREFPGEKKGAHGIVGQAGGEAIDGVGGGGSDEGKVGPAGELDMIHGAARFKNVGENGMPGEPLECGRADEAERRRGDGGAYLHTRLDEPREGKTRFVAGDRTAEQEEQTWLAGGGHGIGEAEKIEKPEGSGV